MSLAPWEGLRPPVPDWHKLALTDPWLSHACGVKWQEASKPPTWTRDEVLRFLSTLKHHEGRDTIKGFLVELLADEITEIVLATMQAAGEQ